MTARTDFASPTCVVEIYPSKIGTGSFTGPNDYAFSGGDIISCVTTKDIRESAGTFSIVLAPSGPANVGRDWAQTIAPMSLVLIGMQRAQQSNIVMIGLVTQVNESTSWTSQGVQRSITISGMDFSYYFTMYNYFASGLLGITPGTASGVALGIGSVAAPQLLNGGFTNGTPQQIGLNFINQAMFGKGFGLMQNTKILYKNGTPISLLSLFGMSIEAYSGPIVKFDFDYVTTEESWYSKFQNIFPAPWYEFFITTAPVNYYGNFSQPSGYAFSMSGLKGAAAVQASIVARVNPTPILTVSVPSSAGGGTVSGVDVSRWSALKPFQPNELRPRQTNIQFEVGGVCNYFAINPTFAGSMYGAGNSLAATWLYTQETAIDSSSMIDFGYRPAVLPTVWYGNGLGEISQDPDVLNNFPQISASLIARIVSTYGPANLMASAGVVLPLRPDIMPGETFTFSPFKTTETWDFYIQAVSHNYTFGSDSTTSLILTNGLPSTIYNSVSSSGSDNAVSANNTNTGNNINVSSGVSLQDVLQGKVVRTAVGYDVDSSRSGVQFLATGAQIAQVLGNVSAGFNNPGGTAPN